MAGLQAALECALAGGLNVVDTAASYRGGDAERAVGRALGRLVERGAVARDDCFVVSKGHSLEPETLAGQLVGSLDRLALSSIDAYLLHNPELQLGALTRPQLERALRAAFGLLERACEGGGIGSYGVASWQAFRVPNGHRLHLELADLERLAREAAGGEHRFRVVELPLSAAAPHALLPYQALHGAEASVLEVARELGLVVLASAALGGRARGAAGGAALAQVPRSVPGVTTALVGLGSREHAAELVALAAQPPLEHGDLVARLAAEGAGSAA